MTQISAFIDPEIFAVIYRQTVTSRHESSLLTFWYGTLKRCLTSVDTLNVGANREICNLQDCLGGISKCWRKCLLNLIFFQYDLKDFTSSQCLKSLNCVRGTSKVCGAVDERNGYSKYMVFKNQCEMYSINCNLETSKALCI